MKRLLLSTAIAFSLSGCLMPSGINPTLGCSPITGCTAKDYYLPGKGVWAPKQTVGKKAMYGAIGGAAVGAYAGAATGDPVSAAALGIIGLVLGHEVGALFDKVDEIHAAQKLQLALDNNPNGQYTYYKRGQVAVRSKPTSTNGTCREFETDVMVGDISRKMKGTACKVNNQWELKELYK